MDMEGLPKTAIHYIITEKLKMCKICAKLLSKVLTHEHKGLRLANSQEMLNHFTSDPSFLKRVVTRNESLMLQYDPETKRQGAEWYTRNSP
ncbi:histone-lysine n-methyltransferase setmar-like protein [Nephila pilipes]|uniref:Histone-lysine n-methyltransferase setmar-like protein n=1 Tax=Nephila pilipes TaxID=299642 RepID=A0A8X6PH61_NEPPI|nr:histone-lysine n-methyltransferase setmar-like protein [Nephila pilipes]